MGLFAVIGLGAFGFNVARTLHERGQRVIAVDNDREVVQAVRDYAYKAVLADATEMETLEALDLGRVDAAVVSLGQKIDASVLVVLHLKELGTRAIYAKALNADHGKILEKVGATEVIHPEREVAVRLGHRLAARNVVEYLPVTEGYSIVELAPPRGVTGRRLGELRLRERFGVQVVAVREVVPDRVTLGPPADFVVKDSDILIVMGADADLDRMQRELG
ncbi:MAG TPA: TrkA family potassium uptake protein [Thermodesulfobacteriota bacterium]|nr:TrkA family potassium uptake protein [Thermodesulfobacteriota bacterium]